ncbi:hypothetical protein LEM8419_00256 [Neolewinella maritima]|uniref:Uncharacterized protein n=1 Tax=Neolewinella maritima TaxID=1383882 RepID=A0ABN8EZZ6_9BACT|nr:hypothetical protein LEM8419_00256 [Neolewinella maritima]
MTKATLASLATELLPYPFEFIAERVAVYCRRGDVVLCCSSGVALDGLKNGAIVVDLTAPGVDLNYYYLQDELIIKQREHAIREIIPLVSAFQLDLKAYEQRAKLFFAEWMSYTGLQALQRIASILDEELKSTAIIYDRWQRT